MQSESVQGGAIAAPGSGSIARSIYGVAIALGGGLTIALLITLVDLALRAPHPGLAALAAGFGAGILAADFLTGLVHWSCDTWGREDASIVGTGLIHFFREHHREPRGILRHDFIEVNGLSIAAAIPLLTIYAGGIWVAGWSVGVFELAWIWTVSVVSALTNQIHYWAHATRPPPFVGRLQRRGLLLSRRRHIPHHRAPHVSGYCISTGWLNGTLDATRFWRSLEWAVATLTGAQPRAHEQSSRRIADPLMDDVER